MGVGDTAGGSEEKLSEHGKFIERGNMKGSTPGKPSPRTGNMKGSTSGKPSPGTGNRKGSSDGDPSQGRET